mgnify:CR=1 FL=1
MGYLAHTSCYLVGPIEDDPSFGRDWRSVATEMLDEMQVKYFNPLDRPDYFAKIEPNVPPALSREEILQQARFGAPPAQRRLIRSQEFIRRICLRFVNTCDFVICYLPNAKTFGTTEELSVASKAEKPIMFICPDGTPSLWIFDMAQNQIIRHTLSDVIQYLKQIDSGKVDLNPIQWFFIKNYPRFKMESRYDW